MLRRLFPDLGKRTLVLGIVNVTPDSFSDGGRSLEPDRALDQALEMMDSGADAIDVGGESTRPGASAVSEDEELKRVMPVIERLRDRGVTPISVDTTKAGVARRALESGAEIVNDISGFGFDPAMPALVASFKAATILGHTRGPPESMQRGDLAYPNGVVSEVTAFLSLAYEAAVAAGVARDAVILDPGIGFGKTVEHNVLLIRHLRSLGALGCPLLLGASRKSFLGALTGRPVEGRLLGSVASCVLAAAYGADLVRVHDVRETVEVLKVADAVVRPRDG